MSLAISVESGTLYEWIQPVPGLEQDGRSKEPSIPTEKFIEEGEKFRYRLGH